MADPADPWSEFKSASAADPWADFKPKAESKGVLGYVDDALRSVAQGAAFGYRDELAAKLDEAKGVGTYEENLKREKARDAQISPWIGIPGQIVGGVASTLAAAPLAAAAVPVAATLGGARLLSAAARLPQFLKYGTLGAAEGGLAGSGGADPGERLQGAATGAAIGAPIGAATPAVINAASRGVQSVRNLISPEANVSAQLGRAITRDTETPADLLQRFNAVNAERPGVATLADVGGENVKGLVERVAQTPGAGRTQVVPALTQRQQGQLARVSNDIKSLTGTNKTAMQAVEETMTARKTAADPLYKEAHAFDLANDPKGQPAVEAFLNEIKTGYGKAIINSTDLKRTLQTEFGVTGTPGADKLMVIIDAWKRRADDIIGENLGSNKANVLKGMLNRVIPLVDEANPAYAAARNAWSGHSKYLESVNFGRDILGGKVSAEEFTAGFNALSQSEQEGARIGAISNIVSKMGSDAAKLGDMTKYLRSPEMRAKIDAILPTPEAKAAWARRLNFEVGSSEMTGRALGNSATARRLAEQEDAKGIVGDLVMMSLHGAPISTISKILKGTGLPWLRDTMRSRADALLADTLTNPQSAGNLHRVLSNAMPPQPVSDLTNAVATGVVTNR